ncbi:hypothetical protein CR513_53589, partial [Mucuna pruriens]
MLIQEEERLKKMKNSYIHLVTHYEYNGISAYPVTHRAKCTKLWSTHDERAEACRDVIDRASTLALRVTCSRRET